MFETSNSKAGRLLRVVRAIARHSAASHVRVMDAGMKPRNETALRPAILGTFLLALLAVFLLSPPGPAYSAGEPGKPSISGWDRLYQGLRVHWYAPAAGGSPITGYEVQYKETGAANWTDGPWVGTARKVTITSLNPNTEYQTRVRAVNANGVGPWSDDASDKRYTLGANSKADPPEVTVIPRNGSLVISWDPPAYFGSGRTSVAHYNVQYTPFNGQAYTYQNWTVGGSAAITGDSVTITGLQNGQDHLVRVRAYNGSASSRWSVEYHGIPKPNVPRIKIEEFVTGLDIPWDLAFTPDGTMLFTEREGVLSARLTDGTVRPITADLKDVSAAGEGGLMSIAVDPAFESNRRFYTCQRRLKSSSRVVDVAAWTINNDYTKATRVANPLVGDMPGNTARHNGCRLRFGPDGYLWVGTGDGAQGTSPQDLSSLGGKVLRVSASTGAGAPGNPFSSAPLIYTYGHRNVQGLALRPGTRQMWSVEHGPAVDDEINLLVSGGNYGWDPVPDDDPSTPRYNEGVPMTDLSKYPAAVAAKWSSGERTFATSGGVFLEGERWGDWEGRLAVATL